MAKPKPIPQATESASRARKGQKSPGARKAPSQEPLGPGLHAAVIELRSGASYRVRLAGGAHVKATLDDDVDASLVEECLRSGRRVILCDGDAGPVIIGALQTSAPIVKTKEGAVTIEGREIRLKAKDRVLLDTGATSLRLEDSGAVRLEGEKMVIDMPALVRILSASVELP